ncbi:transposase [Kitasatospora sp. NPDC089509]|uniref:transposase n=1 Tax=Kitasatospora sp. NPDC089509 TaxID=3364079 RepID=UPI003824435E
MPRQPVVPAEAKVQLVLDLLAGRTTLSAAARRAGVSAQAVSMWRRQFIAAGRDKLQPATGPSRASRRERELLAEISGLKTALGEAHLALRTPGPRRPPLV